MGERRIIHSPQKEDNWIIRDCMYRELDNLLSEESTIDSWYDDGFLIAQSIMNDFSKDDWEKLSNDILNKDLEWKKN